MLDAFNSAVLYAREKRQQRQREPGRAEPEVDPDEPDVVVAGEDEYNEEEALYTLELIGQLDVGAEVVI